jgi:xylulokinase
VPSPGEYVAVGAARQAAWAWSGSPHPPQWKPARTEEFTADPTPQVHERYAAVRDLTEGL